MSNKWVHVLRAKRKDGGGQDLKSFYWWRKGHKQDGQNRQNRLKSQRLERVKVRVMVVNGTFNNISVISWRSVLLVEETCRKSLTNCIT